jgi:hypothetical protein
VSPTLAATWLVGSPTTERGTVEAWARSLVVDPQVQAFVQLPPGRGLLASGQGALLLGDVHLEPSDLPGWATSTHRATFDERIVRTTGPEPDPSAARCLLLTRTYVPAAMHDDFRLWLDEEHSQLQLTVPGNHWYRGYLEAGGRRSLMNMWGLDDVDIAEGEVWQRTRSTPWRERMVPAMGDMDRAFYAPLRPRT